MPSFENNAKGVIRIIAWALYDLANQFFAINILTLYFSRWLVLEKGIPEICYSLAFGVSVFCVAALAPFFGYVSDYTRRPSYFLNLFTIIAVLFTALLGFTDSVVLALIFFAIANFGTQIAVIFYNSLMATLTPKNKIGFVSGLGRMFAYSGAIVALYLLNPKLYPQGYQAVFIGTAGAFLVFALPCMLLLKDSPAPVSLGAVFRINNVQRTYQDLKISLQRTCQIPGMKPFLKAAFFGLAPVNVIILFMAVYAKAVFQLNENEITHLIALGTVFAILGSISSGYISDFIGYHRGLIGIFSLWCLCFFLGALLKQKMFYPLLGATSGLALGSTFVIARAIAIDLIPEGNIGEAFGLFNLIGYLASLTGALFWGVLLLLLAPLGVLKYRIALICLIPLMLVGLYFLLQVPRKKI
jgi:MFS transporter, UMF1 family